MGYDLHACMSNSEVLHDHDLVHRDLKLQNVMIKRDERGQVQVGSAVVQDCERLCKHATFFFGKLVAVFQMRGMKG